MNVPGSAGEPLRVYLFEVKEGREDLFVVGSLAASESDAAWDVLDEDGRVSVKPLCDWEPRVIPADPSDQFSYSSFLSLHVNWEPLVQALDREFSTLTRVGEIFSMDVERVASPGRNLYMQVLNLGEDGVQIELGPGSAVMGVNHGELDWLWFLNWEEPGGENLPNVFYLSPNGQTARERAIFVVLALAGPLGFALEDQFILGDMGEIVVALEPASPLKTSGKVQRARVADQGAVAKSVADHENKVELKEDDHPVDRLVSPPLRVPLLEHLYSGQPWETLPLLVGAPRKLVKKLRLVWQHYDRRLNMDGEWFRVVPYRHWRLEPNLRRIRGGSDFNFDSYTLWVQEEGVVPEVVTRIVFQREVGFGVWKNVEDDARGLFFPSLDYAEAIAGFTSPTRQQIERFRALVPEVSD